MEGTQILNGIITDHEAIHSLKTSHISGMLLKFDMSKDFDNIRWKFLRAMVVAFGFSNTWVNWVPSLVSSSFFSILINGSRLKKNSASRGIQQGGPLSPYLFIILAEGIGIFIKVQVQENHVLGIKLDDIDKVHSCL